jgi:hypothetical protein
VPLIDTSYNRDLLPGLEAGLYGASFRFRVIKEEFDKEPERSKHNPEGIPERTVQELQLYEFGPVTFPAYAGATAGVRSMTDEMLVERMALQPDRMQELLDFARNTGERAEETHSQDDEVTHSKDEEPGETHSEPGSRANEKRERRWSLDENGKAWKLP